MGVLNVTPDSFPDGGRLAGVEAAVSRGLRMFEEGADWVDVGVESTRPGAEAVAADEEALRVAPVVEGLRRRGAGPVSVDTTKADVARAASREIPIAFGSDAVHASLEALFETPDHPDWWTMLAAARRRDWEENTYIACRGTGGGGVTGYLFWTPAMRPIA